jgi:hypothetical protein
MAYTIPKTSSLDFLMVYVSGAAAAAEALGLTALAGALDALYRALRQARDARDDDRRLFARTSAHVRVADAAWDRIVGDLSSNAFLLAGKKADQEPYAVLFGGVAAKDAQQMGPDKAGPWGDKLLEKVKALGNAVLDALAALLLPAQQTLLAKDKERDAAEVKLAGHSVERVKWVQKVQHAVDAAEVEILTAHPGRKDLVRAVLLVPRAASKKQAEDPATEDVPEDGGESPG